MATTGTSVASILLATLSALLEMPTKTHDSCATNTIWLVPIYSSGSIMASLHKVH